MGKKNKHRKKAVLQKAITGVNSKKPGKPGKLPEKALKNLRIILFIAVMIIVFYPPFFRGLYFEDELFPAEIFTFVTFIVFWIYKFIKKDRRFLETPIDYASFGFVIVYFISIFAAVGVRLAVSEWLKYCMYFAVFFMLSELAATFKYKIAALWVIVISSAGVCILGIDGASGNHLANILNAVFNKIYSLTGSNTHDTFYALFESGRINSTMQYPNALAGYLMGGFFVSLALAVTSSKLWAKALAGGSSFIILLTFVFTLSRGAYIVMPIAAVIYLAVLPKGGRIKGISFAIVPVVSALLVAARFSDYISAGSNRKIWMTVFAGMAISVLLTVLLNYIVKWLEKVNWKVYTGISAVLAIIALAGALYIFNTSLPLEISHSKEEADGQLTVQRSAILKSGPDYKLAFDVNAGISGDKPNAYTVNIYNRTQKNILFGGNELLASYEGKATQGNESKEISFKVPSESSIIDIYFTNTYQGTSAVFSNVKILDASGIKIKNITLKYRYLPETITSRLANLSTSISASNSSIVRGIFYKDGLNMIKDRWLLGAGGGAWSLLYFSYQSYLYWSTQAHNFFLQLGVESGIIGLLILVMLIISIIALLIMGFRNKNNSLEEKVINSAIFTAIAAMLMHSAVDFDLALSAIFLLLWELIALYNAGYRDRHTDIGNRNVSEKFINVFKKLKLSPFVGITATAVILILPVLFLSAMSYADAAKKAGKENNLALTLQNMKKAKSLDIFKSEYKIDYANLLMLKKDKTNDELKEIEKNISRAEVLGKYNADVMSRVSEYYLKKGDIEKGLTFEERAVSLKPLVPEQWQHKIWVYDNIIMYYFQQKDYTNAYKYIDSALNIINEAAAINKKNMNPFIFNAATEEMLERWKYVNDNKNNGMNLDISKTAFYSIPAMDINSDGIPDQWAAGNPVTLKVTSKNGVITAENLLTGSENYAGSRLLNLSPNKIYRIEVEFASNSGLTEIPYYIIGISSVLKNLESGGNIYQAQFTVPGEFDKNNAFLRLYVKDKVDIKSILIEEI